MIRKAKREDLPRIIEIYDCARSCMRSQGNFSQWIDGYPQRELLEQDIEKGNLYVLQGEDGESHAVFAFPIGEDPTYSYIEEGAWKGEGPYGTIHRIGSDGTVKGVFSQCLEFCKGVIPHLRADTHRDNLTMQHILEKYGFQYRGVIYVEDGSPRLAYEHLG